MKINSTSAVGLIVVFWASMAAAAPEIVIDQPSYDFGTIPQGKKVEHVFTLRNAGDAPLIINNVRPSCGCTAASVTTSVIPPGKTGGIKSSFDSSNFTGTVHKTIAVDTNASRSPVTTLNLKGTVFEELQVNPRQLNMGMVKINETTRFAVILTNKGTKPVRLTSVKAPSAQMTADADKKNLNPGESARISVAVTPGKNDRFLSGNLLIHTDYPGKAEILVPVYGSLAF
jgi:copper(I)-binding protein